MLPIQFHCITTTLPKITLATLGAQIGDPEVLVESKMCPTLKVHDEPTLHLHIW